MKVRLLRDASIKHKAGEIVEVSPDEFNFLTSVGSAEAVKESEPVSEEPEKPAKKAPVKKTTKKK